MKYSVTPSQVMKKIRDGVRKNSIGEYDNDQSNNFDRSSDLTYDDNLKSIVKQIDVEFQKASKRITPNLPFAFTDPILVSKYKWLGKIIVPIRKLGTKLFTKWYVDIFHKQQKNLNKDIWFGVNNSIVINREQQKLIQYLLSENADKQSQIDSLNEKIERLEQLFEKSSNI